MVRHTEGFPAKEKGSMVRLQIIKSKYLIAAVITLSIFLLGALLGFTIEGKRLQYAQRLSEKQALDYNSMQLQYVYVNEFNKEEDCPAFSKVFDESVRQLEATRARVEQYEQDSSLINREDFELLKREYIIQQLRYWLLAKRANELCDADRVSILYFYPSKKDCPDCENQAYILTYLKSKFGERLLNFALDARREDEPMIAILKSTYSITKYPTLIVGDKKIEGFISQENLLKEICSQYNTPPDGCGTA